MTDTFWYDNLAKPDSTAVETAAYRRDTGELYIQFTSGNAYLYSGISQDVYDELIDPENNGYFSVGRYYSAEIGGNYVSRHADDFVLAERWHTATLHNDGDAGYSVTTTTVPDDDAYSRFAVDWEIEGTFVGGMPEYQAVDEADALSQFNVAITGAQSLGLYSGEVIKVRAVTHYLD